MRFANVAARIRARNCKKPNKINAFIRFRLSPELSPQLSPELSPAWRAYGFLAQEVGGPRAVPPAVPQSRTLQLKLSRIFFRCKRPLTCIVLGPRRILKWHPQRNAFKRMQPKVTQFSKTELLGVVLLRCNFLFCLRPPLLKARQRAHFLLVLTVLSFSVSQESHAKFQRSRNLSIH